MHFLTRPSLLCDILTVAEEGQPSMQRSSMDETAFPPLPPDDLSRHLVLARPDEDASLPHIGIVGDTYTLLLTGKDTANRFCLIDMRIPPGGGPPPHRNKFEKTFMMI